MTHFAAHKLRIYKDKRSAELDDGITGIMMTLPSGTTISKNKLPKNKPECKYCGSLKLNVKCVNCGAG